MPFTISRDLDRQRALAALPPVLRNRGAAMLPGDGPFTLVIFRGASVISSRRVRKALARIGEAPGVVAAGENFTAEAREALAGAGAHVVTLGDFHWTDARYAEIRQFKP